MKGIKETSLQNPAGWLNIFRKRKKDHPPAGG